MTEPTQTEIDLRPHQRAGEAVVVHVHELDRASHQRIRYLALGLLVALNLADILTTRAFLKVGVQEGNPIGSFLIGNGLTAVVKAALLLLLGWRVVKNKPSVGTTAALWFAVGVYACVFAVNLSALHAAGSI